MMPKLDNSTSEPAAVQAAPNPTSRYWKRCALGLVLGIATTGLSGCTVLGGLQQKIQHCDCIDDFMISHRNQVMATRAWFRVKHHYRGHCYLKDFRNGFIAGYLDVANGGAGCTPTVVSSEYWGWRYQSGTGQAAVNAWYEGFPLGAKAAEQDGIGNYNLIQLNGAPQAGTNMTGSASPTPAMAPIPPSTSHTLPPGIVLDEGETLVPDGVTVEDRNAGATSPKRAPAERNLEPSPIERSVEPPEEVPPPVRSRLEELDDVFDDEKPAEVSIAPFSNELSESVLSAPKPRATQPEFGLWDETPKSGPRSSIGSSLGPTNTPAPSDRIELVPRETTPVSMSKTSGPAGINDVELPYGVSEPSQAEIDAVIEEIFGKQAGGSR